MKQNVPSTWYAGIRQPSFPPLSTTMTVDVAIIGGGITGVTAAYLLSKEGKSVALIEKDRLGSLATGLTTAFLTSSLDTDVPKLMELFGNKKAKKMIASHEKAIDRVEEIVTNEKIACEFVRCPNIIFAASGKQAHALQEEERYASQLGFSTPFAIEGDFGFRHYGYLTMKHQAKFHPLKYLFGLAAAAKKNGAQIFEGVEAAEISHDPQPLVHTSTGHDIRANTVVVATYNPFDKALFFKKGTYISYILEAKLPSGRVPEGIYEDQMDPYHYFRVDKKRGFDRLIIGGEDHRADIPVSAEKNFAALEDYMRDRFERMDCEVVRKWRGPIMEPVDGIAFIGEAEQENVLYATGFSGNGMTYGTIAAVALTDAVAGRANEWLELYAADRRPTLKQLVKKGADYGMEFVGGALKNTFHSKEKVYKKMHAS
jgi:glycine/D-amino acid oxidase-like deaminating enzyme